MSAPASSTRLAQGEEAVLGTRTARVSPARRFVRFAWFVLGFNLFVILWGAFVRATGSGAGCGSHWPLCNGEILPRSPALATLIELGHRLTSGVALLLIAALIVGARRVFPPRHHVRRAAWLAGMFIITEALIGAGLVLLELVAENASAARGWWVTAHLGNTFVLVAVLTLTAWWASGQPPLNIRARASTAALLAAALCGVLVLGMSGAVTALGDTLFPAATLSEAKALTFSPAAHVFVRLRLWHPTLAIAVGVIVFLACARALRERPTPPLRWLTGAVALAYFAQLALGLANVWWLAPVPLQLAHLLLSDVIWILLVLVAASALAAAPRCAL